MLDLLISYVNFLILSLSYIVKRLAFFPPKPPRYISVKTDKEDEDAILFLIDAKAKKPQYVEINFKLMEYRFIKIITKFDKVLPLLLFIPPAHIPVCIIYSHGNSGDLGACVLEFYDIAINTNCLVVSFEYPGFGDCMDQPIRESLFYLYMKITYVFVRKILGFKPEQIMLYGFSIGTGIVFDFACHKEFPTAGMIIQSPILSIVRTLYNIKRTAYFDLFNNCDKAKKLCTKTFFIHGNRDSVVPYIHGRILAKLIPQEYLYDFLTVNDADHNNLFKSRKEEIFKKIREFIRMCTGYFSDFSKLNLSENSSSNSNTTIDNNNNPNSEDSKKTIPGEIKNPLNNLKNLNIRGLNKSNISCEQKLNISMKNEINPLVIKQMGNNNLRNSLNKNYQENINKMDNASYLQKMKDNFVTNFFGYNPHDLQNDINNINNYTKNYNNNNYIIYNNTSMNNLYS